MKIATLGFMFTLLYTAASFSAVPEYSLNGTAKPQSAVSRPSTPAGAALPVDSDQRASAKAGQSRDQYVSDTQTKLAQWDKTIEKISARALSPDVEQKNFDQSVASVMNDYALQAHRELDQIKSTDRWEDHLPRIESKLQGLEREYEKLPRLSE
jgi:hypothetical protein